MKSGNICSVMTVILLLVSGCSTSRSAVTTKEDFSKKAIEIVDPYLGIWSYSVSDTPMGTVIGEMVINRNMEGYEAFLESEAGKSTVYNLSLNDNAIKGTFDYEGYEISVTGNFAGDSFTGQMGADYMIFPMKAERKK